MTTRPPLWAVLGTLVSAPLFIAFVMGYVPYAITGWRVAPAFFGWEPVRWVGVALLVLSSLLVLEFVGRFVFEGHGTPFPLAPPGCLVIGGAFRFVRNPSYVAAVLSVIGQGLLFGSRDVLLYAVVLALAFHLFVVAYEEPVLREKFGADYEAYCRRVPRWVPRRPRG